MLGSVGLRLGDDGRQDPSDFEDFAGGLSSEDPVAFEDFAGGLAAEELQGPFFGAGSLCTCQGGR